MTSASSDPFPFPRDYSFPPFFTLQTNVTTRHAQFTKWSALILSYARHHRIFQLSVSAAAETDLFHNKTLNRRLALADIKEVLEFMKKEGRAEYVDGKNSDLVYLWWKTVDEWAGVVETFVEGLGQKGGVLTVWEMREGELTRGTGKCIEEKAVFSTCTLVY